MGRYAASIALLLLGLVVHFLFPRWRWIAAMVATCVAAAPLLALGGSELQRRLHWPDYRTSEVPYIGFVAGILAAVVSGAMGCRWVAAHAWAYFAVVILAALSLVVLPLF